MILVAGALEAFVYRDFIDSLFLGVSERAIRLGLLLIELTLFLWIANMYAEYIPWRASVKTIVLLTSSAFRELLRARCQVVEQRKGDILARLSNDVVMLSQFYGG